jgi:hypothetical protein
MSILRRRNHAFFLPVSPEPHPYAASGLYFRIFLASNHFYAFSFSSGSTFVESFSSIIRSVQYWNTVSHWRRDETAHYQSLTHFGADPFICGIKMKIWHKNRVLLDVKYCGIFWIYVSACTRFIDTNIPLKVSSSDRLQIGCPMSYSPQGFWSGQERLWARPLFNLEVPVSPFLYIKVFNHLKHSGNYMQTFLILLRHTGCSYGFRTILR